MRHGANALTCDFGGYSVNPVHHALPADLRLAPQEKGCTIDLTDGGVSGHRRTQHMLGVWLSGEEPLCRSQPSRATQIRTSGCTFAAVD